MSTTDSTDFTDVPEKPGKKKAKAEAVVYRKPRANVFTVLLIISLLALILGTTLLWMDMAKYNYEFKGGPRAAHDAAPIVALA